jgi:hypothetical protein
VVSLAGRRTSQARISMARVWGRSGGSPRNCQFQKARALPSDRPKTLNLDAVLGGDGLEVEGLIVRPVTGEVELDAIGGAGFLWECRGDVEGICGVEKGCDIVVVGEAACDARGDEGELGADDGGRKVLHAEVIEGEFVLPVAEGVLQAGVFFPVLLISAGHDDGAGGEVGIIGDEDAAFAGVDHLVGLKAEAADAADGADILVVPSGAEGMGSILDDGDIGGIAEGHDGVHVRGVAAHVAYHDGLGMGQFGGEVVDVYAVVIGDLDQNGDAVGVDDGGWDGGEGEGGDEDACVAWQVEGLERQEKGGGAGGDGESVCGAEEGGEFGFEEGCGGILGGGIAEEITGIQEVQDGIMGSRGDGVGIVEVRGGHVWIS